MKVILERTNDDAQMPIKANPSDFCYDVYAVSEEEISPNVWKYGLGFKYEIVRGWETLMDDGEINTFKLGLNISPLPISIGLRPRSGIYKTGMVLANSEGTLDELYRGEACAIFYHVMTDLPRYQVGDRVGQIYLDVTMPMEFEWGTVNSNTERGEGGFGSTGLKKVTRKRKS